MKTFNTIRGFLTNGKEEPSEIIEKYSSAIRIGGQNLDLEKISIELNLTPSRTHKKGDKKGNTEFKDDMWLYETTDQISENDKLEEHLRHLNEVLMPKIELLKNYKLEYNIQLYCSYMTNRDTTGIEVENQYLQLYNELKLPFGVSFDYIG